MTKLLLILILTFSFQSPANADDIRDFQIEGMSIGDSALDYFNESELKKFKRKTKFKDKSFSRYLIVKHKNHSKKFDAVRIYTKASDKNYTIYSLGGMKQYPNNFKKCLKVRDEIIADINKILSNNIIYKKKKINKRIRRQDKSGKSFDDVIVYDFNNGDQMLAMCIDWSKKMKYSDMMDLDILSSEIKDWNLKQKL